MSFACPTNSINAEEDHRYGTYSTSEAIRAGLDLEMPGPSRWRTITLSHAVSSGKIDEKVLDDRARNVLSAIKKASKSQISPDIEETTRTTKADRLLLRRAAAESIVLLKNEEGILPFKTSRPVSKTFHVWSRS